MMELTRIQEPTHPFWTEAWNIYEQSFPLCEQRPLGEHIKALADPAFQYNLLTDEGKLVGLLSWWEWEAKDGTPFRFGEHFAISPRIRSKGYGSQALKYLFGDDSRLVLLEIDPPEDDISRRREQFYLRNGLVTNYEYDHVHPSFRSPTEAHKLMIMSYPRTLTPAEFREFQRFNNERVLSYSEIK